MRDFIIAVNYVWYRFFRRRGEGMAEVYSNVLAPSMLMANFVAFLMYYDMTFDVWLVPLSKTIIFLYVLPLFAINYWMIYWDDKFLVMFTDFSMSKNFEVNKKRAIWYILLSIFLFFGAILVAAIDIRRRVKLFP